MAELLKDTTHRANKPHWCEWCATRIEKGTLYRYQAGLQGGDFYTLKFHEKCLDEMHTAYAELEVDDYSECSISDLACEWKIHLEEEAKKKLQGINE